MAENNNLIPAIHFSNDLLNERVDNFVNTPRILNRKYRNIINRNIPIHFDIILEYCIRKAWADAIIHERTIPGSPIIANSAAIKNHLNNEIMTNNFAVNYLIWHENVCNSVQFGMRYGVWQKFINMTFKYLYCFRNIPEVNEREIPWVQLHCPIDSIIARRVLPLMNTYNIPDNDHLVESIANNGSHRISWNYISPGQYDRFQNIIRNLNSNTDTPSNLFFDFIYWM